VSAGAQRVRLRLSNAFGRTELSVASVCLARPTGGRAGMSSIEPGTSRAMTFAGRPGVVVSAGAHAVSDPVDFPLAAAANVTVTTYLAAGQRASGGITSHPGSRTTSFLIPGDHVADQRLAGAVPVDHWYFLGALEACAGPATGAVVILGDSLTDGRGSTTNGNDRWPDQLLDLMRSRGDSAGIAVLNQGIGGNQVLRDGLGPSIVSRLDRDVLAVSGVRWLVVFAGVNDIGAADATQAAQRQVAGELCTAYEEIAAKAHTAGIAVYGATLTPFGGSQPYDDPAGHREAARQAVNAWIGPAAGSTPSSTSTRRYATRVLLSGSAPRWTAATICTLTRRATARSQAPCPPACSCRTATSRPARQRDRRSKTAISAANDPQ
jgi:lysophospholipase L1-like esterase